MLCVVDISQLHESHIWRSPVKQETRRTGLFWDMGNWIWHRGEKWLIYRFWDCFVFVRTFICLLPLSCNFWLIFKHFPTKILYFLQLVKYKTTGIADFSKSHFRRNRLLSYTQMVISEKAESVFLTMIPYECVIFHNNIKFSITFASMVVLMHLHKTAKHIS